MDGRPPNPRAVRALVEPLVTLAHAATRALELSLSTPSLDPHAARVGLRDALDVGRGLVAAVHAGAAFDREARAALEALHAAVASTIPALSVGAELEISGAHDEHGGSAALRGAATAALVALERGLETLRAGPMADAPTLAPRPPSDDE